MKFKLDGKIRIVYQHGKRDINTFICDYGYPFSAIQAFGLSLGLHAFNDKLK